MDIESVLNDMASAGMIAKKMDDVLHKAGYDDNPYFSIYGHITDAIYKLIGESTETFEESVTYLVMNSMISDNRRLELLVKEYKKTHPDG